MEPIISPWIVYALGVVDGANDLIGSAAIIGAIMSTVGACVLIGLHCCDDDEALDTKRRLSKPFRWVAAATLICSALCVAIPNSQTLLLMVVSNEITAERVKAAGGTLEDVRAAVKSDVIEIIEAAQGDD